MTSGSSMAPEEEKWMADKLSKALWPTLTAVYEVGWKDGRRAIFPLAFIAGMLVGVGAILGIIALGGCTTLPPSECMEVARHLSGTTHDEDVISIAYEKCKHWNVPMRKCAINRAYWKLWQCGELHPEFTKSIEELAEVIRQD